MSWIILALSGWIYLSPEEEMALKAINHSRNRKKYFAMKKVSDCDVDSFGSFAKNKPKGKKWYKNTKDCLFFMEEKLNRALTGSDNQSEKGSKNNEKKQFSYGSIN